MLTFVSCLGLALLVLARSVEPDPRGYGTHEQLGAAPCWFQQWAKKPCPMCGATTAWAYAVRGQGGQAVRANLGGALLCVATVVLVPWMLFSALAGRWVLWSLRLKPLLAASAVWLMVALLDWGWRCWLR